MEMKNANPDGFNVVINNLCLVCLFFFQKYWKLSLIKDFDVYFNGFRVHNYLQTRTPLITFNWFIKMEWFKASHLHVNLENQFQIFIS